jgi:quercetin dioxygenase-like cupin family protein
VQFHAKQYPTVCDIFVTMINYLTLNSIEAIPTAHSAGIKKVLSRGHADLTRLTQIAYGSLATGESIPAHHHKDMEESFFFTRGAGLIIVDEQEFALAEGVFIVIPAQAEHYLECTGEGLEFFYFGLQVY